MRAQHVALGHARLRLTHDELVLAQGAARARVAAFDQHALRQRPRVLARGAVHVCIVTKISLREARAPYMRCGLMEMNCM